MRTEDSAAGIVGPNSDLLAPNLEGEMPISEQVTFGYTIEALAGIRGSKLSKDLLHVAISRLVYNPQVFRENHQVSAEVCAEIAKDLGYDGLPSDLIAALIRNGGELLENLSPFQRRLLYAQALEADQESLRASYRRLLEEYFETADRKVQEQVGLHNRVFKRRRRRVIDELQSTGSNLLSAIEEVRTIQSEVWDLKKMLWTEATHDQDSI